MFVSTAVHLLVVLVASLVFPVPAANLIETRSTITSVPSSTVTALTIYGQFSRISYCPPSQISSWTCGQPCSALPDFIPYLVGGDIGITPYYYVGYWPAENTAVIVHQGRPPYYLASLLKNFEVPLTPLDITLFPGLGSSIKVHSGFASVQALTAKAILAAVNKTLSDHSISKVTIVGHSLGGAIGMIDMVYLRLHLPSSTSFKFVGHGIPRVGNQAFADYVDSTFFDVTRINYAGDPIPIVPGLFLGYHHVSGEVHILKNNTWIACAGQDNPNIECSTGDVPTLLSANPLDHLGPYNGIWFDPMYCTRSTTLLAYWVPSLASGL